MPRHYFCRSDRLNGLAQAHVIADQRPAGSYREQRAIRLIGIERRLQKRQELGIGSAAWEQLLELANSPVRIPPSGDEIESVVLGTELVTGLRCHRHEKFDLAEALLRKHAVALSIEQSGGGLLQRRRAIRSGTKMHTAFAVIAQIQLGKCRVVAACKRRLRATLFPNRASVNSMCLCSMCLQVPSSLAA